MLDRSPGQNVAEILDAIKAELNTDTRPGRYVLTGSTTYSVLPQAAHSLTGRAHIINVLPLSQGVHQRSGAAGAVGTIVAGDDSAKCVDNNNASPTKGNVDPAMTMTSGRSWRWPP